MQEGYKNFMIPKIDEELFNSCLRADAFFYKLILLHWILVSTISAYFYNTYIFGFLSGGILFLLTVIAYRLYSGTVFFRIFASIVIMTFSIISIQQNLGRIEMHFHVFIALSFLAVYKDALPIILASAYTIIYHLLFTYLQLSNISVFGTPISIYNYGCGYDIAFLHAFYVVFEAIILYIIVKKSKESFQKINEFRAENDSLMNAYNKHVIFSKTDLKGIITNVSDAFCKISGYTREELIGKPHNIVRHPDMPASAFKEIWDRLKAGLPATTEIKNLKKDGGYYWVKSVLNPDYNSDGEKVGYTSVRFDITSEKEVEILHEEIEATQREIIFTMGSIGESRSKETGNHVKRVAEYSKIFALHYGLSEEESELFRQASPMHDIGKVGIPDSILKKPGRLNDEEILVMKTHAEIGYKMLNVSSRPLLKAASIVAYEHHEKFDGSGYPRGLRGEEIHTYGRITAIADVFDALGSDRCYKKAWDDEKIFALLKEERGKHFDPKLVDIFFENIDEFLEVRSLYKDELYLN